METGLRIHNVEKTFNTIHRGFTKKDDYPLRRYFEESLNEDVQFLSESAYADACRPGNPRDTSVEEIAALFRSLL